MPDSNNQTSARKDDTNAEFPVAAIACLSVGGYVLVVILVLIVRRMLVSKGSCQSCCCGPESKVCCSFSGNIKDSCLPCSRGAEGCWSQVCGTTQSCSFFSPNILCDCTGLSDGCCTPLTDGCHTRLPDGCCSCLSDGCCSSCFESDLDPNSCACLCLEIKLRSSHNGDVVRSLSAPSSALKNQTTKQPTAGSAYTHDSVYQDSDWLVNGATNSSTDTLENEGAIILEHRPTLLSSTRTTPNRYMIPINKSNNATIPQICSANSSSKIPHPNGKNNAHVNFPESFKEFENSKLHYTASSTVFTSSSSGDSLNMSSRSLLNKSTNTDSSIDSSGRPVSRSRKSLRPGKLSQRFPNKVLVSSESLKSSLDKSRSSVPQVSFIQSSETTLPNMLTNFDALSCQRPLPSIKKSSQSSI